MTSIQIVELNRVFMTSKPPSSRFRSALLFYNPYGARKSPGLNDGHGKNLNQLAQVQDQGQALLVPQHGAAVRHVRRRVVEERFRRSGGSPDPFGRGDPHMHVLIVVIAGQYGDDDVAGRQPRPAAFGDRDIHGGNNRAAQIEDAHQERRSERHARHQRPVHPLFDFEYRKTKPLAPSSKHAKLPGRRRMLAPSGNLGQFIGLHIRRKGIQVDFIRHQANRLTSRKRSTGAKGFTMYPLAPCCSAQKRSLAVDFPLTTMIGILLYACEFLSALQTWKPLRSGMTTSSRMRFGPSESIVCSIWEGSLMPMALYPSFSRTD